MPRSVVTISPLCDALVLEPLSTCCMPLPQSITVKFNSTQVDDRLAGVNEELEKLVGEAGEGTGDLMV